MAGEIQQAIGEGGLGIVSGLGDTLLQIVVIVAGFVFLGGAILGFTYWLLRVKRSYNYDVYILEPDAMGGYDAHEDKGGVFEKKKLGQKFFWLKNRKVPMSPQLPFISLKTKKGIKKMVFMVRDGPSQNRYIDPKLKFFSNEGLSKEDFDKAVAKGDGLFKPAPISMNVPKVVMNVREEDVNWASYAYKELKAEFGFDWMKWLDVGVHVLVVGLLMFMFIYLIKEGLPQFKAVADAMNSASQAMREASIGGSVI